LAVRRHTPPLCLPGTCPEFGQDFAARCDEFVACGRAGRNRGRFAERRRPQGEIENVAGRKALTEVDMNRIPITALVAATAWVSFAPAASAEDNTNQRFGMVHFATSCNETAQRRFDRAMRYQHSFWYQSSKELFEGVLEADPGCAIAYWGIALSLLYNPHAPPPPANLPLGLAALRKGQAVGARSQRERDYIDALAVFYEKYDTIPHPVRVQAYLKAMAALAQKYPDDDEAQIFYAITLNVAASPKDKTYANQLRGAAILEPIFKRQPMHPGIAHYLIHLYDTPALAPRGLDAARRYAKIAPAAPHALHMPSHIFTRVGAWGESISSNIDSARAANEGKDFGERMHAMDYLIYAYLQTGQDEKARAVLADEMAMPNIQPERFVGPYALAVGPARYAMERGDWNAAANLQVRPSKFAYADAMTYFARALGAARSGHPDAAAADMEKLAELRERLRAAKDAYWSEQVDIQWRIARAWLLHAEGKFDEALEAMRAAADAEDKTEKHPVTPGAPTPARELFGQMLLDRGMAREALAAFEATLKKEPNRFDAIASAAKAAQRLGDTATAKTYFQKLASLASGADTVRPDLAAAREFLAKN
jgi:tetratricopeptide (TPR) repeat protein